MKLLDVNALCGILARIRINKISDKAVKAVLVNDYLHLRRFAKQADDDRQEIVKKFREDWREELPAIEAFRRDGKPVTGHDAFLGAEADANNAVADIFDAEVQPELKPVRLDAFLNACAGEEISLEQVALLQEGGIIE